MLDTGLENPLLADDSGLGNAVEAVSAPAGNPYHFFEEGEDGNWYRDGERVYYWVPPAETNSTIRSGGETQGIGEDLGGYYTQDEILSYWNADEGMGYLKEQTSLKNYLGFLEERQQKIQSGDLTDPIQAGYSKEARANAVATTDPDAIESERQEEAYYAQVDKNAMSGVQDMMAGWVDQNSELMGKYGIDGAFQNEDKDWLVFNGSTYTKIHKEDDHSGKYGKWLGVVGEIAKNIMLSGGFGAIGGAVAPIVHGGLTAMGVPASVATILSGGAFTGAPGQVRKNTTRGGMIDDVNRVLNDPNIIINFTESGWEPPETAGDDYEPDANKPFQGDGEGVDFDGNAVWNTRNLPSIYSIINGDIVHTESGTVMSEGNYSDSRTQYVSFPPYVDPDKNDDNSGGGSASNTATSAEESMTQEEANAAISDLISNSGLSGQELYQAIISAGVTPEQAVQASQDGIYTTDALTSDSSSASNPASTGKPNLVIYDGNPKLLDPDGPWQPGGTAFDRTDPAKPRRYYVWVNKETGEEWKIYDDELGTTDKVADYEAYIKDELPDITKEEEEFIKVLVGMGDPIGQAIEDVKASRDDLNNPSNGTLVNLPGGGTATIPSDVDPNAAPQAGVGNPCQVGPYKGVVQTAPSGNLFCNISEALTEAGATGDTVDVTAPVLKAGDACELGDGSEGVLDGDLVCQPKKGGAVTVITGGEGEDDATTTGGGTNPQPGDSCQLSDGSQGEIDANGNCQAIEPEGTTEPGTVDIGPKTITVGTSVWSGNGPDNGPGNGPGNEPGDNGPGEGGNGAPDKVTKRGSSATRWSPLYATNKFRKFNKNRGNGMKPAYQANSNLSAPRADFSQDRMGLLSSLFKDLS